MPAADGLDHVLWVGGGSGAGKSTVARRLAARHGLRVYDTDAAMTDHVRRSSPRDTPRLQEILAMDADTRWVDRSPLEMLDTFHWFCGEAFELIVADLGVMPRKPPVIVEGFRLLPDLVAPLLGEPSRAVWLLPTRRFRGAAFESRGSTSAITGRTSDPDRALANLLERDALFTDLLRDQVADLGLGAVDIDLPMTEGAVAAMVEDSLGLRTQPGAGAHDTP